MTKQALTKEFTLTVAAKDLEQKIQEKLTAIQKEAKMPGFRAGQVPMKLIEGKYKASVMGEALDETLNAAVTKELEKQKIRPALPPKLELKKFEEGKDVECAITVEILPEVKPVDIKGLKLTKRTAKVDEKDIEKTLERLRLSRRKTEPSKEKRKTKLHDIIVIDFVGTIDGKEFKGGQGKDYYLDLGSNTFIPGFEEQLVGQDVGATVDVNVTFPKDYHAKELAGKKALFKTTIKELRDAILPELDDTFAKDFGADTMDALKDMIRTEMGKDYENVSKNHMKREALDLLDAAYQIEVPEGLVKMEFDAIWKQIEQAKKTNTLDPEDVGKSDEELKKEYEKIATRRVKLGLILAEIAKDHKITVTPEELNHAILEQTRRYPGQEKQVLDYFKNNPAAIDSLKGPMLEAKVMDFVIQEANLTQVEMTAEELYAYDPDKKEAKKTTKKGEK